MKLSEITTEDGIDLICELIPYITEISSDDELVNEIKRKVKMPDDSTKIDMIQVGVEKVNKIVPILLKKKKNAVYGIIATLEQKPVEDIARQTFYKTIRTAVNIAKDKEFWSLFNLSAE